VNLNRLIGHRASNLHGAHEQFRTAGASQSHGSHRANTNEELRSLARWRSRHGHIHGDGKHAPCMATASRLTKNLCFDAPPYTYKDFGSRMSSCSSVDLVHRTSHHVARRADESHRPESFVIDPRRTETAMARRSIAIKRRADLVPAIWAGEILI